MYASGNPLSRVDANGFCDFSVGNMSASSIIPWTWKPSLPDYSQDNYLNAAQTVLTGLGMLPVVGTAFNVINAGISYNRIDIMELKNLTLISKTLEFTIT